MLLILIQLLEKSGLTNIASLKVHKTSKKEKGEAGNFGWYFELN